MLDIWPIPFSKLALGKEEMLLLSYEEKRKAEAFLKENDCRSYLLSHLYLRKILSSYFPVTSPSKWAFEKNSYGKPSLLGKEGFHFNLSHTQSCAYVVCSDVGACGIDVEEKRNLEITESLVKLVFSKAELTLYEKSNEKEALFYQLWTLKEAHLKAVGTGLMKTVLSSLCFADNISLKSEKMMFSKGKQRYWTQRVDEKRYMAVSLLNAEEENHFKYRNIKEL